MPAPFGMRYALLLVASLLVVSSPAVGASIPFATSYVPAVALGGFGGPTTALAVIPLSGEVNTSSGQVENVMQPGTPIDFLWTQAAYSQTFSSSFTVPDPNPFNPPITTTVSYAVDVPQIDVLFRFTPGFSIGGPFPVSASLSATVGVGSVDVISASILGTYVVDGDVLPLGPAEISGFAPALGVPVNLSVQVLFDASGTFIGIGSQSASTICCEFAVLPDDVNGSPSALVATRNHLDAKYAHLGNPNPWNWQTASPSAAFNLYVPEPRIAALALLVAACFFARSRSAPTSGLEQR